MGRGSTSPAPASLRHHLAEVKELATSPVASIFGCKKLGHPGAWRICPFLGRLLHWISWTAKFCARTQRLICDLLHQ